MTTAVRSRMVHRCTVERDQGLSTRYAVADWQPSNDDQPCFLYVSLGREPVAPDRTANVDDMKMLVPLDSDIKTIDRINGVRDRAGHVVLNGILNITSVLPHHDHLEIQIVRVSG